MRMRRASAPRNFSLFRDPSWEKWGTVVIMSKTLGSAAFAYTQVSIADYELITFDLGRGIQFVGYIAEVCV